MHLEQVRRVTAEDSASLVCLAVCLTLHVRLSARVYVLYAFGSVRVVGRCACEEAPGKYSAPLHSSPPLKYSTDMRRDEEVKGRRESERPGRHSTTAIARARAALEKGLKEKGRHGDRHRRYTQTDTLQAQPQDETHRTWYRTSRELTWGW